MKSTWIVALAVLFLINVLNFYDRNVAGALAEPMKAEFGLSDRDIGLLGSAFIWIYAIVGVPLGRLADRLSRKTILLSGLIVWSSLTAMNALAQSFGHLMFTRLGVGVGEAVVAPAAASWIGDLFPAQKRARALAFFMLGVPIGGALAYVCSGPAAQAFGWRTALVLAAAPALILAPALLFLKEPARGASEEHTHSTQSGSMWSVLKVPTMWWIIASGALLNFNMYAYGTFLVSLFVRTHKETLATAGLIVGAIYAIGGLTGGFAGGTLGDLIVRRKRNGRMLAASYIALAGMPLAYLGIQQPNGSWLTAAILLTLAYAACNSYYGLVYASIQDIVPPNLRGSAMSLYFLFMYMCGAALGPLLTGQLSDWRARVAAERLGTALGPEARAIGLQEAMLIIPLLSLLLAGVLWAGSRTIARDIDRRATLVAATATSAVA
ncbi:MFS transporter [Bryobacterales bacterium F-183]|nr:MFS transporter [Bryobacterales bacterium F-183]